jgi:hypothetical protein
MTFGLTCPRGPVNRDLLRDHTRQAIRRGTFTSVAGLKQAISAFIDGWNEPCKPFVWTKTPDDILSHSRSQKTSFTRH